MSMHLYLFYVYLMDAIPLCFNIQVYVNCKRNSLLLRLQFTVRSDSLRMYNGTSHTI